VNDEGLLLIESSRGSGPVCRAILEALPSWFGIPEAVDDYVSVADRSPTVIARVEGRDVGFLTVVQHSEFAAEIHAMGVVPDWHRRGIGTAMLDHVEASLAGLGVEYLQVKTLSASHPDQGYARTRAFYLARGFRPLEEFPDLWNPANPALQLIKALNTPLVVTPQGVGEGARRYRGTVETPRLFISCDAVPW
jgi:GNAT superfamily N-acetyltransferase